ncbi:hypothetical protein K438DRAFT_1757345 [Mycena galopus ATCC 62051]|nr:hypothetical protein K438DRAFT_1757345 [Mycena galopus ATCC 62051]
MHYKKPPSLAGKPFVVLGAGAVGRRIAMMWLTQGETVHLVDPSAEVLADASQFISDNLQDVISTHVRNGKPGTLVTFQDRAKAVQNAWIVVEVDLGPEGLPGKIALLELDMMLPDDCILASACSSYTGSEMFEGVKNAHRLVVTHYRMPHAQSQVIPLEIMPTPHTDPAVVKLLLEEAPRHGLRPYHLRKESVGLLTDRIWAALTRECMSIVAEGVTDAAEVDSIMKDCLGISPGAFESLDEVGLDAALNSEIHYSGVRGGQISPKPADLLKSMVEMGTLGVKSGKGFYEHPPPGLGAEKDRIVYLEIGQGEIRELSTDYKERKTLVKGLKQLPDGVQIDRRPGKGQIYWTNMGWKKDGFLSRCESDGSNITTIIPPGVTLVPKQLVIDTEREHLYWCDREGGKVMRCKLDGTEITTLYMATPNPDNTPHTDTRNWCVGLALDKARGLLYWSQKGPAKGWRGRIFRMNVDLPAGVQPECRTDVEVLFDGLPEPIDLELYGSFLYWADRGDVPFGNTLNCADVSAPLQPGNAPRGPNPALIIAQSFHEAIGLTIDPVAKKVYVTDLLGSLWVTELDGTNKTAILRDVGNFAGITFLPGRRV